MSHGRRRAASGVVGVLSAVVFVVAVGSGVVWTRYHAAQLPAEQAVSATGYKELAVTGLVAVAGFLIGGLVALAVLYALDDQGKPGPKTRRGLIVVMASEVAAAIIYLESGWGRIVLLIAAFAIAAVILARLLDSAARVSLSELPGWLLEPRLWQIVAAFLLVLVAVAIAIAQQPFWVVAAAVPCAIVVGVQLVCRRAQVWRMLGIALLTWGVIALLRFEHPLAVVAVAAVVLAGINLGAAKATHDTFAFYGVAVFLSVVLFGGVLSYVRTQDHPKVRAIAVLVRGQAVPTCGLYVGETGSRLYLGRVDVGVTRRGAGVIPNSGRIFWLRRGAVERMELGPPQLAHRAQGRATELRDELLAERGQPPPPAPVDGTPGADHCAPRPPQPAPRSDPQTVADRALAEKFQPRLVMDRRDGFWPISALTIYKLRRNDRATCLSTPDGSCVDVTRPTDLPWSGGTGEWLNYPGRRTSQGEQHDDMVRALRSPDPQSTAREYYFVTGDGPGQAPTVQYWFYYGFDYQALGAKSKRLPSYAGHHEGDFESVSMLLSPGRERPEYVWMARHNEEGRAFAWDEPRLQRSGNELTVYSARGSHASYEACGNDHREQLPTKFLNALGLINDNVTCNPKLQIAFAPGATPLSDLALAPWACWEGRFGNAYHTLVDLYFAAGPMSPLWQQKFGKRAEPCAAVRKPPQRAGVGEEVLDSATATTLRQNGGTLQPKLQSCETWLQPPAAGVYVVACAQDLLTDFFNTRFQNGDDKAIAISRLGHPKALTVPAIYRSPDSEGLDGTEIAATGQSAVPKVQVYAACYRGEHPIVVEFKDVRLEPGRPLTLHPGAGGDWTLTGGADSVSARASGSGRCDDRPR